MPHEEIDTNQVSPDMPATSNKPKPKPAVRKRSLVPSLWVWIIAGLLVAAMAWVRIMTVSGDHAVVNLLTLILAFLILDVFAIWFYFRSGYSRIARLVATGVLVGGVSAFFAVFEIYEVSGELIPLIRMRSTPVPDRALDRLPSSPATAIDLATSTGDDFPGFLGPQRLARVDSVTLDPDWLAHPPVEIWRREIGAGWSGFAAANGYAVTLEQRGDEELVACYEVETGRPLWAHGVAGRHSTVMGGTGPRSTPTIDEGRVYTLGAMATLLCLDGSTGSVIWQDDLLERYGVAREDDGKAIAWGRSNSPLIVDDLVVVPAGGPLDGPHVSLAAFNKRTGELVWEAGDRQVSYSSPALATLDGVQQIVSVNEDNVSGHDIATGRVLWEIEWPGKSNANASVSQAVPVGANRLLLSKGYGAGAGLHQLQLADDGESFSAEEIWRESRLLKTKFTNVVIHEGHAYGLSDGILECVELATGERAWKKGRYGQGQILGVGDFLLVQAEMGDVALVAADPAEYRELAVLPALDGKTWNTLCLTGPLLLCRNSQTAACFRLPVKASVDAEASAAGQDSSEVPEQAEAGGFGNESNGSSRVR